MSETQENKMGVLPINKLILSMSLPMMLSMLVQALYNVVDSVFVAQINQDALTALSVSFPMQLLSGAFATADIAWAHWAHSESSSSTTLMLLRISLTGFARQFSTFIPSIAIKYSYLIYGYCYRIYTLKTLIL